MDCVLISPSICVQSAVERFKMSEAGRESIARVAEGVEDFFLCAAKIAVSSVNITML